MDRDVLRVLAVLASAAVVFGLLRWERQVAGPNPVLLTLMVLCVVVGVFCAGLLVFLAADHRTRRRDMRKEMEAWQSERSCPHPVEAAPRTTGWRSTRG